DPAKSPVTLVPPLGLNMHAQRVGDPPVGVAGRVLIDQRRPVAVVSHPRLEAGRARAAPRRERVLGVAKRRSGRSGDRFRSRAVGMSPSGTPSPCRTLSTA